MIQKIERLPSTEYIVPPSMAGQFNDGLGLHALYDGIAFNLPTILVGPKGVGKSLSFTSWCAKKGIPLITYSCSEDARLSHLVGMYTLRGDETPFILGPLAAAIDVANETGAAVLDLEEINALTPQMQKLLNGMTDFRRCIEAPQVGKVFKLQPNAKLWVVGTMNFSAYGGVNALNEDLKSRFTLLTLGYPTPEQESALVQDSLNGMLSRQMLSKIPAAVQTGILRFAVETRQGACQYALSPRDVVQTLVLVATAGLENALWALLGKFEENDRAYALGRLQQAFGANAVLKFTAQIKVDMETSRRRG